MCGIAGIIQTSSSRRDLGYVKKMTDTLAHRGPDGQGLWQNESGTVLLGHRRLSVIDLSDAGQQPMHYLNRYTIIHNGEVYNYIELRDTLEKKGYRFSSETDTEVIAAAYDHCKEDCLQQFDGMFAFVIWDEQEKKLFAARDRFGEKPFFYFMDRENFIFSSEIKGLWAAGIHKTVNRNMLFNYLTIGYTDNPAIPEETFYEDIYKLPAATFLVLDTGSNELITEKYWQVDPEIQIENPDTENITVQFEELLHQSVKRRLRSDVPLGTSLSGGLDSSSIVASISGNRNNLALYQSFSAIFPGFEKNEEEYIDIINQAFSWKGIKTTTDETRIPELILKVARHLDEPFGSASNIAQYIVYESAKKNGYTVLLDGQGADEVLGGYTKYYKWYWQELFRNRHLYRSGELRAARQNNITEPFTYKNIIAALFPGLASVILEQRYLMKAIQHPGLSQEFVKQQSREAYFDKPVIATLNGALYYNTFIHGLEELLRYADRNSMAHGVEVRLPFLSHQLVEFLFSLPSSYKIRDGYTKWILRKGMDKQVPASICWRKEKVGFEPPQKKWMENAALQAMIQEAKQKLVSEKILKPSVLNKDIRPLDAYEANNYDWRYLSASFMF